MVWGYTLGILALLTPYLAIKCIRGVPARQLLISRRWPLHLVRAGCLIGSIATSFVALAYIPLIDATTVMFMSPLFVNLLASPLLGERVGLHRWLGVLIGLAGVLIIIQPGTVTFHWATLLAVLSAMFFAMFQVITRRLAPEENTLTMLFLTAVGGVIWSSCLVVFVWQPLDLRDAAIFLGLGALGVAAHFSHIKAFAHAPSLSSRTFYLRQNPVGQRVGIRLVQPPAYRHSVDRRRAGHRRWTVCLCHRPPTGAELKLEPQITALSTVPATDWSSWPCRLSTKAILDESGAVARAHECELRQNLASYGHLRLDLNRNPEWKLRQSNCRACV